MFTQEFYYGVAVGFVGTVLLFSLGSVVFLILRPWVRIKFKGGRVSLPTIIGMRLRGAPIQLLEEAYTSMIHSGEKVSWTEVESLYFAHQTEISSAQDLKKKFLDLKKAKSGKKSF